MDLLKLVLAFLTIRIYEPNFEEILGLAARLLLSRDLFLRF